MSSCPRSFSPRQDLKSPIPRFKRNCVLSQVSKEWQRLVFNADSEELKTFKYSSPRKCLKCDQHFRDSADMFIHIRNVHVRKPVNKSCEKYFHSFFGECAMCIATVGKPALPTMDEFREKSEWPLTPALVLGNYVAPALARNPQGHLKTDKFLR